MIQVKTSLSFCCNFIHLILKILHIQYNSYPSIETKQKIPDAAWNPGDNFGLEVGAWNPGDNFGSVVGAENPGPGSPVSSEK